MLDETTGKLQGTIFCRAERVNTHITYIPQTCLRINHEVTTRTVLQLSCTTAGREFRLVVTLWSILDEFESD